jgi:hypothetical protein
MKKIILLSLFTIISLSLNSQSALDNICWIKTTDSLKPSEDSTKFSKNLGLNLILNQFNVLSYELVMGDAKTPILREIIEIKCSTCNIDDLNTMLQDSFPNSFYDFERHHLIDSTGSTAYVPADGLWNAPADLLWHLKKTECDKAWDLTTGSSNIKIAIFDHNIDVDQPDIINRIIMRKNPYAHTSIVTLQPQPMEPK